MDYAVPLERMPALRAALDEVADALAQAVPARPAIAPPGEDPVSVAAAEHLGAATSGRHESANHGYQDTVAAMVDALHATVAEYDARETDTVARFRGLS